MWFTLAKGWLWFALAGMLGIVIGWLLRSIVARRQLLRARGKPADATEIDRLRGRVAELESTVVDRDRLRAELDACRAASAAAAPDPEQTTGSTASPTEAAADPGGGADAGSTAVAAPAANGGATPPDVAAAAAALGTAIELDDLKVVEGIGPKIEQLCHGIGIATWADLAATEVSLLRTMLADAGPRFRTQDPSTWPHQAGLLAHGRWSEFKAFIDEFDGGRTNA